MQMMNDTQKWGYPKFKNINNVHIGNEIRNFLNTIEVQDAAESINRNPVSNCYVNKEINSKLQWSQSETLYKDLEDEE